VIRPEDKHVVVAVAVQIFCARLSSNDAKRANGESKHGYSPDMDLCIGEAAALVNKVNMHLPPSERPEPIIDRRKNHRPKTAVELTFRRELD
jgi:hypothetical protein